MCAAATLHAIDDNLAAGIVARGEVRVCEVDSIVIDADMNAGSAEFAPDFRDAAETGEMPLLRIKRISRLHRSLLCVIQGRDVRRRGRPRPERSHQCFWSLRTTDPAAGWLHRR
jgi:hypothetical protein